MRKILFVVVFVYLQCVYSFIPIQKLERYNASNLVSTEKTLVNTTYLDKLDSTSSNDSLNTPNNVLKITSSNLDISKDDEIDISVLDKFNRSHKHSLEKSVNAHEKEIFENGYKKVSNVSERSFIWLNTRFERPLISRKYNYSINEMKIKRRLRPSEKYVIFDKSPMKKKPQFTFAPAVNVFYSPYLQQRKPYTPTPLFTPHQDISKIPCAMPGHFTINQKANMKCIPVLSKPHHIQTQHTYQKFRQQLPFVIPTHKTAVNKVKKPVDENPFISAIKSYNVEPRQPNLPNQHVTSITRHKIKDAFVYPNMLQQHHSAFSTNQFKYKPEELMNMESNLFSDNNYILSPVDINDEEDKLLERYIKHTLADNGVHILDDEDQTKCPECEPIDGENNTDCTCKDNQDIKSKLYSYIEKKTGKIDIDPKIEPANRIDYDEPLTDDTLLNKTFSDIFYSSDKKINNMNL